MEMLISPAWLQRKIESEPEENIEAGFPTEAVDSIDIFLPQEHSADSTPKVKHEIICKTVFGIFIRNLRCQKKLTIHQLSKKVEVDEEEISSIENDPSYQSRPRTVHQLAKYFNIDKQHMMKLSGVTQLHDEALEGEALKFAAKSNGVSSLNKEQQRALNDFVKYLNGK